MSRIPVVYVKTKNSGTLIIEGLYNLQFVSNTKCNVVRILYLKKKSEPKRIRLKRIQRKGRDDGVMTSLWVSRRLHKIGLRSIGLVVFLT